MSGRTSQSARRGEVELAADRDGLPRLWGRRGVWQIRLRWAVAPLMIVAIVIGRALGFEFRVGPILAIALASLLYNALFAAAFGRYEKRLEKDPKLDRVFTILEVVADYAAIFLLLYFTGGTSSPLLVFLIFHVIIAAIQFSAGTAYGLAALAAGGLWIVFAGEVGGWLPYHQIVYRGEPVQLVERPPYAAVWLLSYTATLFITAGMVSSIMQRLRSRVGDLAEASWQVSRANQRLRSLYKMLAAIGAERRMKPLLTMVAAELADVTDVPAVAIKLLSEDGRTLSYVAAHGLPDELINRRVIHLDQSPMNRRIVEGETLVEGRVRDGNGLQLSTELADLGIQSAVLAPLSVEDRVIGTLGFYAPVPDRFDERDREFIQVAAELVAIAIDHARAYEAIERLIDERTQFMLEVAHNLRAPLAAGLSILDLLNDGYLGSLRPRQLEHLQRVEVRLRALDETIGELLALARTRDTRSSFEDAVVDPGALARHTEQVFREEAKAKEVELVFEVEDGLQPLTSGHGLLERVMENLVSNAVKYTPAGGHVRVSFDRGNGGMRVTVSDTGIGIPDKEQRRLFEPFFRASNAKRAVPAGTGLGLAYVKQVAERQGGWLEVESHENEGTTVRMYLPFHPAARPDPAAGRAIAASG